MIGKAVLLRFQCNFEAARFTIYGGEKIHDRRCQGQAILHAPNFCGCDESGMMIDGSRVASREVSEIHLLARLLVGFPLFSSLAVNSKLAF